jgi:DHA3 family tetracycline resistance protein-like MFS transporter
LPLLLGGALAVALGATLIFLMRERNFRPARGGARSSWHRVGATAGGSLRLVRVHPVLLIPLAVVVFFGMSGEGFDSLWEAHFLKDVGLPTLFGLHPVLWFGLIDAGTLALSYLATEVLGRNLNVSDVAVAARLLFVLNALTVAGVLAIVLAGSFALALGAFWFASLTRKVFYLMYLT